MEAVRLSEEDALLKVSFGVMTGEKFDCKDESDENWNGMKSLCQLMTALMNKMDDDDTTENEENHDVQKTFLEQGLKPPCSA